MLRATCFDAHPPVRSLHLSCEMRLSSASTACKDQSNHGPLQTSSVVRDEFWQHLDSLSVYHTCDTETHQRAAQQHCLPARLAGGLGPSGSYVLHNWQHHTSEADRQPGLIATLKSFARRALPAMRGSGWACCVLALLVCNLAAGAQDGASAADDDAIRGAARSLLLGHARHYKAGDKIKVIHSRRSLMQRRQWQRLPPCRIPLPHG
jgi:hypothetical protein